MKIKSNTGVFHIQKVNRDDPFALQFPYYARLDRLKEGNDDHANLELHVKNRIPQSPNKHIIPFHPALESSYLFNQLQWGTEFLVNMKRMEEDFFKLLRESSFAEDQKNRIIHRRLKEELDHALFLLNFLEARHIRTKAIYEYRAEKAVEYRNKHADLKINAYDERAIRTKEYNKAFDQRVAESRKAYWIAFDKAREVVPQQSVSSGMNLQKILTLFRYNEASKVMWLLKRVQENTEKAHADQLISNYSSAIPNTVLFNYSIFHRPLWEKVLRRVNQDKRYREQMDWQISTKLERSKKEHTFHLKKKLYVRDLNEENIAITDKLKEKLPIRSPLSSTNTVASSQSYNKSNPALALTHYRNSQKNILSSAANQKMESLTNSVPNEILFRLSAARIDETDGQNIRDLDPPFEMQRDSEQAAMINQEKMKKLVREAREDQFLQYEIVRESRIEDDQEFQHWLYRKLAENAAHAAVHFDKVQEMFKHAEIIQGIMAAGVTNDYNTELDLQKRSWAKDISREELEKIGKVNETLLIEAIDNAHETRNDTERRYYEVIKQKLEDQRVQYAQHKEDLDIKDRIDYSKNLEMQTLDRKDSWAEWDNKDELPKEPYHHKKKSAS